jgi:hypothetical protein
MSRLRLPDLKQESSMKILATAIACAAILASPVYAATTHSHRAVAPIKRQARVPVMPSGRVFLLENRAPVATSRVPDFQDNFSISY